MKKPLWNVFCLFSPISGIRDNLDQLKLCPVTRTGRNLQTVSVVCGEAGQFYRALAAQLHQSRHRGSQLHSLCLPALDSMYQQISAEAILEENLRLSITCNEYRLKFYFHSRLKSFIPAIYMSEITGNCSSLYRYQ